MCRSVHDRDRVGRNETKMMIIIKQRARSQECWERYRKERPGESYTGSASTCSPTVFFLSMPQGRPTSHMWPVTHHSSSSSSSSDRRVENKKGARHREGRMMIKKRRRQKATLPYGDTKSIQHLIMARFNWPLTPLPRTA